MTRLVRVQAADFSPEAELAPLLGLDAGGIGSFLGIVRRGEPEVQALTLEHYPGMTERAMTQIAEAAMARFALLGCVVVHRVGRLRPGERIVFVAAAARHRAPALAATAFLIDWLKTEAPFWKRERFVDGGERWVDARQGDDEAAARW